jgi:gas vesicle protein
MKEAPMQDQYEVEWGEDQMGSGSGRTFLFGVMVGAAVGAALGLLYAPQAGEVTRRGLRRSAERLSKRAQKLYDDASQTMEDLAERGADVMDRAKVAADQAANRVSSAIPRA